jgi:hypothetical protein
MSDFKYRPLQQTFGTESDARKIAMIRKLPVEDELKLAD